jgi:hypothetical protein
MIIRNTFSAIGKIVSTLLFVSAFSLSFLYFLSFDKTNFSVTKVVYANTSSSDGSFGGDSSDYSNVDDSHSSDYSEGSNHKDDDKLEEGEKDGNYRHNKDDDKDEDSDDSDDEDHEDDDSDDNGPSGLHLDLTLTSNPHSIFEGATSTLTWVSTGALNCSASWTNSNSTSGSFIVSPTVTTFYGITCYGKYGSVYATTTVTVSPFVIHNPSVTLTASSTTIFAGATSTLSWTSTNTTSCSASWTAATSTSGFKIVSPATTTAYLITCTNGLHSATSLANITVVPPTPSPTPTVTLSAQPSTITPGATSTLTWISTNTTSCSATWTAATSTSGFKIVSPATTTSYTILCSGQYGSASSTANISVTTGGGGVEPVIPILTLVANPTTISAGATSTLSWASTNITSCGALWTTATSTSGTQSVSPTSTTNYEIVCNGPSGPATSSATVTVTTSDGGGVTNITPPVLSSGGGGGGIGGRRHVVPQILGATTDCNYLKDYMKIGWTNDPVEVIKLQVFLKELEGFKDLNITGVFDQATYDAVSIFQERYMGDILTPWGETQHTGFVYILTKKKVNEIVCNREFPINDQQKQEIKDFNALMMSLKNYGIEVPISKGQSYSPVAVDTLYKGQTFNNILSQNGVDFSSGEEVSSDEDNIGLISASSSERSIAIDNENDSLRLVASAIFSGPQGWDESINTIIGLLVSIFVLYLISNSIVNKQNVNNIFSVEKVKTRKLLYFISLLIIIIGVSFGLKFYTVILPFITLIIFSAGYLLWFLLSKKEVRTLVEIDESAQTPLKEMNEQVAEEKRNIVETYTNLPLEDLTGQIEFGMDEQTETEVIEIDK